VKTMKIELGTIKSSPFVGVFAATTDKIALIPKALEAKEKGDTEAAKKYLFFRRIQNEAKDYVLNVLNTIFFQLDRWIEIKSKK